MVEALLLDLSGVLYDGDQVIPGALDAVSRAHAAGLEMRFLTNTSRKTRASLLAHLHALGFELDGDQLFTAVDAATQWLSQRGLRPFCLVHEDIRCEFGDLDQSNPDDVLVARRVCQSRCKSAKMVVSQCCAGNP